MTTFPDFGWFHPCECGGVVLKHPGTDTAQHVAIEASGRIAGRVQCKQLEVGS